MQPFTAPLAASAADVRNLRLWQIAKRRAKFQSHLVVFILVNAGLWALWLLTPESYEGGELPWPIYTTLFWGIFVVSRGLCVYSGLNRGERIQREYERLHQQL